MSQLGSILRKLVLLTRLEGRLERSPKPLGNSWDFSEKIAILAPFGSHSVPLRKHLKELNCYDVKASEEYIAQLLQALPFLLTGQVQNMFKCLQFWIKLSEWLG